MRTTYIIGNWKMYGNSNSIDALLRKILTTSFGSDLSVVVCPPSPYLYQVQLLIQDSYLQLGAQNIHYELEGPFTGEVSAKMLIDLSCRYVIIGHSERRQLGECDELIAKKCMTAQKAGLTPILCIGENLSEYEAGQTVSVLQKQLQAIEYCQDRGPMLIAYEPVWAIGTGKVASASYIGPILAEIRKFLKIQKPELAEQARILYGGSVNSMSAVELLSHLKIDGFLVGGASLNGDEFLEICHKATEHIQSRE